MAIKIKASMAQIEAIVAEFLSQTDENGEYLFSSTTFNATKNNIVELVDKIGKIITLRTSYYDKMPEMDGEDLPLGKTIEEYFIDLIQPYEFDREGEGALKFYEVGHRPVCYSYSLGRKKFPLSIPNGDVERAVNDMAQMEVIIDEFTKKFYDSMTVYKYACKRELLGKICDLMSYVFENYNDDISTLEVGSIVSNGEYYISEGELYIVVKDYTITRTDYNDLSLDEKIKFLIGDGALVKLDILKAIAKPVDTETGENFIQSVLEAVEVASDVSEGNSFNGNTIGANEGLILYVKQGVMPSVQVRTLSGAFHKDELAIPATVKVIKDFGNPSSDLGRRAYAILLDTRACRLHEGYRAVRENFNGDGDFLNLFGHLELTAYFSRNAFVKIFVEPEE